MAAELELIRDLLREKWWQDVTVPMLKEVRRRLRTLIALIETSSQAILYTRFINEIIDELTSRGVMDPARLCNPPSGDLAPTGAEGLFSKAKVTNLCSLLDRIRDGAAAALSAAG